MYTNVVFPISIQFEDGEVEYYEDVEDLEMNLEDFDSNVDIACQVKDKFGRPVHLKVKLLELKEMSLRST